MTAYVNTDNKGKLNLREKPDTHSKILVQIPYKATLETTYVDDTWCKTSYEGKEGYVMTKFLSNGKSITKNDLQEIYNSLKVTLATIEKVLS